MEECHSTNKIVPVQHADIQLPDLEDVYFSFIIYLVGWSKKVQQRKGPGTGRQAYTKTIPRIFKNNLKGIN